MSSTFIFVSTEDDKYLVKGGIASYLGNLVSELKDRIPDSNIFWITQSPYNYSFCTKDRNLTYVYLTRIINGRNLDISEFAPYIEAYVETKISEILLNSPNEKIYIESPDWEGLLARFYERNSQSNILKVTRLHGPMGNCFRDNFLQKNDSNLMQHKREGDQVLASDLISCPTEFIHTRMLSEVLEGKPCSLPHVVYGNMVHSSRFEPNKVSQSVALSELEEKYNISFKENSFKIFAVGSLEPRKGSLLIADALDKLFGKCPDIEICFIGLYQVEQEASISSNSIKLRKDDILDKVSVENHSKIHFTGVVDHKSLSRIVHGADCHFICYLADNFPGVLSEIALSELPLITTLKGGIPEMIWSNKEQKYLTNVIDDKNCSLSESLINTTISVRNNMNLASELSKKLRVHILEHFAPSKIINEYINNYSEALSKKLKTVN